MKSWRDKSLKEVWSDWSEVLKVLLNGEGREERIMLEGEERRVKDVKKYSDASLYLLNVYLWGTSEDVWTRIKVRGEKRNNSSSSSG